MKQIVSTLLENKKKINELIQSLSKPDEKELCKSDILGFLHKVSFYTENFFINEEMFLKEYKLPSYQEHVDQHKLFVRKMLYFQDMLEKNKTDICKELVDYLSEWYKSHVLKNDNEIVEYFENNK